MACRRVSGCAPRAGRLCSRSRCHHRDRATGWRAPIVRDGRSKATTWNRPRRIPEPHAFTAHVRIGEADHAVIFEEHERAHGAADRDNNMRAAVIHVIADAAVSVLVIVGLSLARTFGWLWMDPLAGIVGACVIASWSYGLIRDTGAILLDMNPDRHMAGRSAPSRRERGRPTRRSPYLAVGAGASWGDYFGDHDAGEGSQTTIAPDFPSFGRCHI